jgi:hypothetical protein
MFYTFLLLASILLLLAVDKQKTIFLRIVYAAVGGLGVVIVVGSGLSRLIH